ncbi:MAG: aminotransferase class I/II-fold pyridoxal phosphate-dependent enzyme, partial [Algicola sp.]|nr:aminotransferase class I/II-fold pyridoxal phosphate-dependent enzyme [Algicola sp.]
MLPEKLNNKLKKRRHDNALRHLGNSNLPIDFSSNDYLGFCKSEPVFNAAHELLKSENIIQNGATGSRLLSGNHVLYDDVETILCEFHTSESALIFNSGYSANLGFFSCVPQRDDIILYDEFIHASIRDGLSISHAKSHKFKHNNLTDLKGHLERIREVSESHQDIYVATESIFSMDGDSPDLKA